MIDKIKDIADELYFISRMTKSADVAGLDAINSELMLLSSKLRCICREISGKNQEAVIHE